jgi:hypothetical protein
MKRTQSFLSPGPWSQLVAVTAICPDGKIRKVRVGTADTYFTAPGRCRVAGINVHGYVTKVDNNMWLSRKDPRAITHLAANPNEYHPDLLDEVLIPNPNAEEWEFRVTYNNVKFDALFAKIIAKQCTCGWTAGHDNRCPATDAYLTVLKKEEYAAKEGRMQRLGDAIEAAGKAEAGV